MKVLIVPDVHGSHEWEIVKEKANEVDYIVFLGDYFDSWENVWPDQGDNFLNICKFIRENPEKRKLLLGNHDFGYLSGTRYGGSVSGHQKDKHLIIRKLLEENIDILDLAFEVDGIVFSHAGFTKNWVLEIKECLRLENWSIDILNEKWHNTSHDVYDKNFNYGFDELLDWHGRFSGTGDEPMQGPLWVRPSSLLYNSYYPRQVVGHTECSINNFETIKYEDTTVILCDSATHKVFGCINTEIQF